MFNDSTTDETYKNDGHMFKSSTLLNEEMYSKSVVIKDQK